MKPKPDTAPPPDIVTVKLSDIVQDPKLQVRPYTDRKIVKEYVGQMNRGAEFPPVSLGNVGGALHLLDGWHRVAAHQVLTRNSISATVVECTYAEAGWLAARANLKHGHRLSSRKTSRKVFHAYVIAGEHRLSKGKYKTYRDMEADLAHVVSYGTLRRWMQKDHPSIFMAIGDTNSVAKTKWEHDPDAPTSPELRLHQQALNHLDSAVAAARGIISQALRQDLLLRTLQAVEQIKAARPWNATDDVELQMALKSASAPSAF